MDNVQTRARGITEARDWLPYEEYLCKLRLLSLEGGKNGLCNEVWNAEGQQGMLVYSIFQYNNSATSNKMA